MREPRAGVCGLQERCLTLSPAPLTNATWDMEDAGVEVEEWDNTREALRRSYVWFGVDTCVEPAVGVHCAMMIMGKAISRELQDDRRPTPGPDRVVKAAEKDSRVWGKKGRLSASQPPMTPTMLTTQLTTLTDLMVLTVHLV